MTKTFFQYYHPDFFIEHVRRPNTHRMPLRHDHPEYEFYYLVDGDRNFFVHDRTIHLTKGQLLVIPPNTHHRSIDGTSDHHERILIELNQTHLTRYLNEDFVKSLMPDLDFPFNIYPLTPELAQAFQNSFSNFSKQQNSESDPTPSLIFIMTLCQMLKTLSPSPISLHPDHPSHLHRRIGDIVRYTNANYHKDIGLETVASDHFISAEHLSRSFKKITGMTFNQYLNTLRLKDAANQLRLSNESIADIADTVGYQSHTHFGRVFKHKYGLSPSAYRRKVNPQ